MHVPVLWKEVETVLEFRPGLFVVDGTLGGGGHATMMARRIAPNGTLLGIDRDPEAIRRVRIEEEGVRIITARGSYADLPEVLRRHGLPKPDRILLDLGFSSDQLEESGRGFSFLKDEPLLMTYDPDAEPVRTIMRRMREAELAKVIREYGGERMAGRIARAIVAAEKRKAIGTSKELAEIVRQALPKRYERGRIDPATRTFQALRIYANEELEHLEKFLEFLSEVLAPEGRVAIISFHSLEDRMVKRSFRKGAQEGQYELLTRKPIVPKEEEVAANPRSRSAKVRAVRRIA